MGYWRLFWSWFGSASGLLAFLCAISITMQAENLEHEDILTIQGGGMWLQDQYLSPLQYDGVSVGITNEWWQAFRGKKRKTEMGVEKIKKSDENIEIRDENIKIRDKNIENRDENIKISDENVTNKAANRPYCGAWNYTGSWEHVGKVGVQVNVLQNTPQSNEIYAIGVNAGWGAYYSWKWSKKGKQIHTSGSKCMTTESNPITTSTYEHGFEVGIGPYLAGDFMPRYIMNNVNKPYSMDIAADIDAMAFVSYSFGGKNTSYRLRYLIRTNLIGIDFMPDYWQSYYEITEGIAGRTRCAGMWNHRYLNHELTLDMQFKHSTWRIGVRHEYLEYGEKSMWFSREQVSAVIGTCFRYRTKGNQRLTR